MARLTQTEIKTLADEWAELGKKIDKAASAMEAELEPLVERHNEAMKPIREKWGPKIAKLEARRDEVEGQVHDWLRQHGKPISIEGASAVATNQMKESSRRIDAQTFFKKVSERSAAFWACVTIAVQKADKYLGKDRVDEISTKEAKLVASLSLK